MLKRRSGPGVPRGNFLVPRAAAALIEPVRWEGYANKRETNTVVLPPARPPALVPHQEITVRYGKKNRSNHQKHPTPLTLVDEPGRILHYHYSPLYFLAGPMSCSEQHPAGHDPIRIGSMRVKHEHSLLGSSTVPWRMRVPARISDKNADQAPRHAPYHHRQAHALCARMRFPSRASLHGPASLEDETKFPEVVGCSCSKVMTIHTPEKPCHDGQG